MAQARLVDVIIPVKRIGPELSLRLRAVLESGGSALGRLLIVVDAAAADDGGAAWDELTGRDPRCLALRAERGASWVDLCNRGLSERRGDALILHPEATPYPGWLDALAKVAHSAERVALVAPLSEGDGLDAKPVDPGLFDKAVVGLPVDVSLPRSGAVCNYIRGDIFDAVGPLEPAFASPRAALDDWLARARAVGFFAKRALRVLVSVGDSNRAQGDWATTAEDLERLNAKHPRLGEQVAQFERSLDAKLAAHAVNLQTTGKLKIALDLRHLPAEVNGTKNYAMSLGKALAALPEVDLTLLAIHPLQAEGVPGRLVHPDDWTDDVALLHKPAQIFDRRHSRLLYESSAHVVLTYQDLIAYRMADVFNDEADYAAYRNTSGVTLPATQAILNYSGNTAEEIEGEFGIPAEDLHTVLLGVDIEAFAAPVPTASEIRKRLRLPDRYFFSLASDHLHKNIGGLLEAYSRFREGRPDGDCPALVLAGFASSVEARLGSAPAGAFPGVVFLGGVSDEELKVLYQSAEAFVFPSLYEGFGLPPLEAIAAGAPVVAMPFTSVPEVCADGVLYADGLSPDDLARAMGRIIDDESLRAELRERGRRRIRDLQWEETARGTCEAYRKAILNPPERSLRMRRALTGAIAHWADADGPFATSPRASAPPPSSSPAASAAPSPASSAGEPEPMGVINACQALQGALKRRIRRDLAHLPGFERLKGARLVRLSRRFVQVARADGPKAASRRALRKIRAKSRAVLARWRLSRAEGPRHPYFQPPAPRNLYEAWRRVNAPSPRRSERLAEAVAALERPTMFSILIPVYNPPVECLAEVIQSVLDQTHEDWELILSDDASTDPRVRSYLDEELPRDPRVRLIRREANGHISAATNTAAEHARGEFFVLVDHDDVLRPDALAHLAIHIHENPDVDLIYTDDDKLGPDGVRFDPQFKPDWSPELLLSYCYVSHLAAARGSLYRRVGGMRVGYEGSQDHDFWLRASELARSIGHIPQITYHWRVLPGSTAAGGDEKSYSFEAGRRAVEEAFARRGVPCPVERPEWGVIAGGAIFEPIMPDEGPSVAVLIDARKPGRRLETLLVALQEATYRNHRVYLITDAAEEPRSLVGLDSGSHRVLRVESPADRSNLAAIRNRAAAMVSEKLLLFLDESVEPTNPRWLSQMVGWSRLPGIGAVGPKFLSPDRRILDVGLVHGLNEGLVGRSFRNQRWQFGDAVLARANRNCVALAVECLLTHRRLFLDLGGFDETRFPNAHADADYGWRLCDSGHRNVVCGEIEMTRREDPSRRPESDPLADANYRKIHGERRDPYFSPHLDVDSELFLPKPTVAPVGSKDRPIPILAVTHNLNWEGAPGFQLELISGLKAMGAVEPTVISPVDGPLRAEYEKAGIHPIIEPSLSSLFESVDSYEEIRGRTAEWIAREGFEAAHVNTLQGFWAVDAARLAGVASVWSIHESESWRTCFDHLPRAIAQTALSAMSYPYRVVFASRSTEKLFGELNANHAFELIRYGLDIDRFAEKFGELSRDEARAQLGLAADEVCVLLLGTVCERKGQHDLLSAFQKLDPRLAASTRCFVVGARDDLRYGQELKRLARKLPANRRERFRIVDETGETAPYWLAADVFCCSSRVESYPYVILEAMARGLPIITTPVFGIAEQVRPDVNALTYFPGDVNAMRRHLETLIRDGERRRRMGAASSMVFSALPSHAEKLRRYAELFRAAAESGIATVDGKPPSGLDSTGGGETSGVWSRAARRVARAGRRPALSGSSGNR